MPAIQAYCMSQSPWAADQSEFSVVGKPKVTRLLPLSPVTCLEWMGTTCLLLQG
jgi:hypothetical protein